MQYMLLQEVPLDDMIYVTSALIIDEISIVAFYLFIYLCGIHQQSLLISIGPLLVYKPSWLTISFVRTTTAKKCNLQSRAMRSVKDYVGYAKTA